MSELSPRQREIARLVKRDLSSKAIARQLGISPRTVDDYVMEAARRIPGTGPARFKLWTFNLDDEPQACFVTLPVARYP